MSLADGGIVALRKFLSYSDRIWEKTLFCEESEGFVVTSRKRIADAKKNKQEMEKFLKEQRMCKTFASFGFQIEHLSEMHGVGSPDVLVVNSPYGDKCVLADLKSTSSSNNIQSYAKRAVRKQRARLVLFEFTRPSRGIIKALKELTHKGIRGYYYRLNQDVCGRY